MSRVIKDKIRIYVRFRIFDDDGEVIAKKTRWLGGDIKNQWRKNPTWNYSIESYRSQALDFQNRYADRALAMDMAHKLAKIVKVSKEIQTKGYVYDLFMVRDVTTRTAVSLSDNPMVVLAVSALGD